MVAFPPRVCIIEWHLDGEQPGWKYLPFVSSIPNE